MTYHPKRPWGMSGAVDAPVASAVEDGDPVYGELASFSGGFTGAFRQVGAIATYVATNHPVVGILSLPLLPGVLAGTPVYAVARGTQDHLRLHKSWWSYTSEWTWMLAGLVGLYAEGRFLLRASKKANR